MAGRVLFVPSSVYESHKTIMYHLAEELVKRGHHVSIWGVFLKPDRVPVPKGVEDISWTVKVPESYIQNMFLYENASVYKAVWKDSVSEPARKAANWAMALRMCEVALETRRADFEKLFFFSGLDNYKDIVHISFEDEWGDLSVYVFENSSFKVFHKNFC
ncbi:hypothetical protein TTRE_0000232001 [Trichuris trichiura]|uniref:Uncharacterized protein n=1 Tax=Trichuris trichiura TaxID=36087 RepID=A0A077Z1S9_TRITR|nr:hypothetical protein TTRE_0000232001 [Trichuris trichiura]